VRSKANVDAGAGSVRANFVHGACLLLFVTLAPGLLGFIPLAALAAMLVYTGGRLASPRELVHVRHIGMDQLALFLATLCMTLLTDLLIGVATGLVLEIVLHMLRGAPPAYLFRSRVEMAESDGGALIRVSGAAAFPSLLPVQRAISKVSGDAERLVIDLRNVCLVDHTFLAGIEDITRDRQSTVVEVVGHETLRAASSHPHATRWSDLRKAPA